MNKALMVILGLILLNLGREYTFVRPQDAGDVSIDSVPEFNFDIQKKDWGYYSSVFDKDSEPLKSVGLPLPLVLCGTIVGNPQSSFAIIETDGKQDLYRLGDVVSGVRIVAMNRNRVLLDYKGAKQELFMCEAGPRVQDLTLNNRADFARIMTQLRIKPYFEGGRCIGFQLSNINPAVKQMGLQDGDIVETINGVRIDDPLRALEILYRSNPVHLGIERKDEKLELDCRLEG